MAGYLIGPSSPTHSLIALVSVVSRGRGNGIVGVARMGSDSVVRQYIREGAAPVIIIIIIMGLIIVWQLD